MDAVIIDSGGANLASLQFAFERLGAKTRVTADPAEITSASRVILPGVGSAADAMVRLRKNGVADLLPSLTQPVLGICLGMQLLFEEGEEDGRRPGLGLLPGRVTRLPHGVQVPHIGWQKLRPTVPSALEPSGWAYFAHSYRCEAPDEVTCAVAEHGPVRIAAVVGQGTLFGVQYHPEKSAQDGEALLRRFLALPGAGA